MVKIRKKKTIDGIDREIIRVLCKKSPIVTRRIGKFVGLTSPSIIIRLNNLRDQGIIKVSKVSGIREFYREYKDKTVKIRSPQKILWGLDLVE
jgi:DNA-binding Lrp family transcriptional regulator